MSKVHGDNGGVSEKVFFDFDREYGSIKSQISTLAGKMRSLKKRGEEDGIDVQEYEYQRKRRQRPLEERRKAYENGLLYLRFWRDPLGAAMTSIPEVKDEVGLSDEERQKKWEDEGYVVGAQGGSREQCPHQDPNSPGARFWMAGYDRGQATLAPKKKAAGPAPVEDGPTAGQRTDTETGKLSGGVTESAASKPSAGDNAGTKAGKAKPKDEPEVAAAKARGKAARKGVTYWHNPELKKVYEIDAQADAQPEGAVNITKPEFDRLQAEYAKAEDDDWNSAGAAATKPGTMPPPAGEDDDDGDDDNEDPPLN